MAGRSLFPLAALPVLPAVTIPVMAWKPNSWSRPVPPAITPHTPGTRQQPGNSPWHAPVLFHGKDLSNWEAMAATLRAQRLDAKGPTAHMSRPPYKKTPDQLPIQPQDHNHPVRLHNIRIRELRNE
jgi:hypothetical protein